jgi:hypothetical protein
MHVIYDSVNQPAALVADSDALRSVGLTCNMDQAKRRATRLVGLGTLCISSAKMPSSGPIFMTRSWDPCHGEILRELDFAFLTTGWIAAGFGG